MRTHFMNRGHARRQQMDVASAPLAVERVLDIASAIEATDVEAVCTELVGWQNPYLMVCNAFQYYVREHTLAEGRDHRRIGIVAKHVFRIIGPETDVRKVDHAETKRYFAVRKAEGKMDGTIRRELALTHAAINHNVTVGRIGVGDLQRFWLPEPSPPHDRWLTRDEHRRLMQAPMPHRIKMFLLLAFGTGARSAAIQELTWDRINWRSRTVDFRVPGVKYRNKRRVLAPLGDALFARLESAYQRRNPSDPLVIGAGRSTYLYVKAVLKASGIDERGVCRHVARHTFCSWLVQADVSYAKIGALVGDGAAMVEAVYGHLAPDHTRDAANLALLTSRHDDESDKPPH